MRFYSPKFLKRLFIQAFLFLSIFLIGLSTLNVIMSRYPVANTNLSRRSRIEDLSPLESSPRVSNNQAKNLANSGITAASETLPKDATPQMQAVLVSIEKGTRQETDQLQSDHLEEAKMLPAQALDFTKAIITGARVAYKDGEFEDKKITFKEDPNQVEKGNVTMNDQVVSAPIEAKVQAGFTGQGSIGKAIDQSQDEVGAIQDESQHEREGQILQGQTTGELIGAQGQTESEVLPAQGQYRGQEIPVPLQTIGDANGAQRQDRSELIADQGQTASEEPNAGTGGTSISLNPTESEPIALHEVLQTQKAAQTNFDPKSSFGGSALALNDTLQTSEQLNKQESSLLQNSSNISTVQNQIEFVQEKLNKDVSTKYTSVAAQGIPDYVLEAIPSKIRELFPFEAVYDFDIENKAHTDQQQADRRITRLRNFCASPISRKTGIRNVHHNKAVYLYEGYNMLECAMAKTGEHVQLHAIR